MLGLAGYTRSGWVTGDASMLLESEKEKGGGRKEA